jgi:hypothetical protein
MATSQVLRPSVVTIRAGYLTAQFLLRVQQDQLGEGGPRNCEILFHPHPHGGGLSQLHRETIRRRVRVAEKKLQQRHPERQDRQAVNGGGSFRSLLIHLPALRLYNRVRNRARVQQRLTSRLRSRALLASKSALSLRIPDRGAACWPHRYAGAV